MAKQKRIAVMASGGDGAGMNACLYYLSHELEKMGYEVYGVVGGYQGLVDGNFKKLSSDELIHSINRGGCVIRAGRSKDYLTDEGRTNAGNNFKKMKFECLVVIGGNGSFKGMLDGKPFGIMSVGIPATIDNDIFYTDYSLGFDSARNANISLIKALCMSTYSQNKIPIVEIMGRDCGKLTLSTAIGCGADYCIIKEEAVDLEKMATKINKTIKSKGDVLIVCAENNIDLNKFGELIKDKTGKETKLFVNGYAQRGADASGFDRELAAKLALECTRLIKANKYFYVVGVKNGETFNVAVEDALQAESNTDLALYKMLYK